MKLYIKQKVFSIGDKFTVRDENGNDRYFVEGEIFTFRRKFHISDTGGNEVAYIEAQSVFNFLPKYDIYLGGKYAATISKKFTFFIHEYSIDGEGIEIEGDAFSHEYEITKFGSPIAYIHKEWFTWGDSYCIDTTNEIDELLAVSIAITIDSVIDRNSN